MFPGSCLRFPRCPAVLTKLSTASRAPCTFILVPSFSVLPPPPQLSPSSGLHVSPACLHSWLGSFCWGLSGPERRGQAGPPLGQGGDAGRRTHSTGTFGGLQSWGRSRTARHSWEVLGQHRLLGLVLVETSRAPWPRGRCSQMGTAVPGAGCAGLLGPAPRRRSASPRRGPATSVYSDFSSWKEKQGPLFRRN